MKEARYKGSPPACFLLYEMSRQGKSIEIERRLVASHWVGFGWLGWGVGGGAWREGQE